MRFYIKHSIFLAVFLLPLMGAGCDTSGQTQKSDFRPYKSDVSGDKVVDCSTLSLHNPFEEGSGHFAGYEWAQENGADCNGNSISFNEGCEEYDRQQVDYDNCVYHK